MISLLVVGLLLQSPQIARDAYGVPHIVGKDESDAFFQAGYAVAQDRMWQMETSRRLARGKMAEVFGGQYANSDKEVLRTGYTDEELDQQYNNLSAEGKTILDSYVKGVNAWMSDASAQKALPEQYAGMGFAPSPWTKEDSLAIGVRLFQLFGRGGAGELRNMALLSYLQAQPNAKDKALDIIDDFLWQNDPASIPTVPSSEDALRGNPPLKVAFTRAQTEAQLAAIPKLGLFELVPALQMASRTETTRVAERMNVPFKTGSYCVIVGPSRSSIGAPLLLSGPQMGHTNPAIVHEMSIQCPEFKVTGMDVPGFPGVAVGMTPHVAWGLTSGVADTEDIYDFTGATDSSYKYGDKTYDVQVINRALKVKGVADQEVKQQRTMFGPVMLHARGHFFARRSAYWMHEMDTYESFIKLYHSQAVNQVEDAMAGASMNFNFFYVLPDGNFGYAYLGRVPVRAPGLDPRWPTPAVPANDWRGFLSPSQLPHVRNPRVGVLANWNNKPAAWWPNMDTPVWGEVFRNEVLLEQVRAPKLTSQDLEQAAWSIARVDDSFPYFRDYLQMVQGVPSATNSVQAAAYLHAFDGRLVEGSIAATIYLAFFEQLRSEIFLKTTGNFISPDLFRLAAQPTVMLHALQGKTRVKYLGGRSAREVVQAAFLNAVKLLSAKGLDISLWGFRSGGIPVPQQPSIPYSNRGSYIQVIEMWPSPVGRNVLPPGEAEVGAHAYDQVPLARAWIWKHFGF